MNKDYWKEFYKKGTIKKPSSFSSYVQNYLVGDIVELGCGNGRDLFSFLRQGLSAKGVDNIELSCKQYTKQDVGEYIKENDCPDTVYARFFWHSIERELQLAILKWTKNIIMIEARTTEDEKRPKLFPPHDRNYVDVPQLVKDLKDNGFQIIKLEEGEVSRHDTENPHLCRVIAQKI